MLCEVFDLEVCQMGGCLLQTSSGNLLANEYQLAVRDVYWCPEEEMEGKEIYNVPKSSCMGQHSWWIYLNGILMEVQVYNPIVSKNYDQRKAKQGCQQTVANYVWQLSSGTNNSKCWSHSYKDRHKRVWKVHSLKNELLIELVKRSKNIWLKLGTDKQAL